MHCSNDCVICIIVDTIFLCELNHLPEETLCICGSCAQCVTLNYTAMLSNYIQLFVELCMC